MVKLEELVTTARDAITVRRVFAEPYEKDGVTVIAAARVRGGGGGGGGHDEQGQEGEGGGFGMAGRPAGAYVVKDGSVTWLPAVDPVRIVAVVGAVLITLLIGRTRVATAGPAGPRVRAPRRGGGGRGHRGQLATLARKRAARTDMARLRAHCKQVVRNRLTRMGAAR